MGSSPSGSWSALKAQLPSPLFLFSFYCVVTISRTQVALVVKNPPANAGDVREVGSIPGSGRSPGEGHGAPF